MNTAEEILNSKDLHWTYAPNGDHSKPYLHDKDCTFCHVEDRVLEAMREYGKQCAEQALKDAAKKAKTKKTGNSGSWFDADVDEKSILNTPIQLP